MNDSKLKVLKNENCAERTYRIRLENFELARESVPGQFVNVRTSDSVTPLLRRPFSIHRVDAQQGWIEVLFDVRGTGTRTLSQVSPGDFLSVLGPLGKGFALDSKDSHTIFVAGGLGIAPFCFVSQYLRERKRSITGFYGTRTKNQLACMDEFAALEIPLIISTEDGSLGEKGLITTPLVSYLKRQAAAELSHTIILACGPPEMLREIQAISRQWGIPAQLSLETYMACGMGICVGCAAAVPKPTGVEQSYKLVCKDGPIFNAEEVVIPG
ncbi:dihydroorotate dehydrogenase electron transfer subunit [candidate division KSB1 bacterium]|nr:dihydroorotate dehydrogenase electron transfer subunit [candidate division KSB1 bacterium]